MFCRILNRAVQFTALTVAILWFAGCEQILEELTSFTIVVEETVVEGTEAVSSTEETEVIVILDEGTITKHGREAVNGFWMRGVPIPDPDVLIELIETGGLEFEGTIRNRQSVSVQFGIYFANSAGITNPSVQAAPIATLSLEPNETRILSGFEIFNEPENLICQRMIDFLNANPYLQTLYVYLTGTPSPVHIVVSSLSLVLHPSYHLERTIEPDPEYEEYFEQVQDIQNVELSGSATNHGASDIRMKVCVYPVESADWEGGTVVEFVLGAGETLNFSEWSETLVPGGMERLENAIHTLVDANEAIRGEIYIRSATRVHVVIQSLVFKGKLKISD